MSKDGYKLTKSISCIMQHHFELIGSFQSKYRVAVSLGIFKYWNLWSYRRIFSNPAVRFVKDL